MCKDNNKKQTSKKIPLHCINLTHQLKFRIISLKLDHHTRGKWFIHGPNHHKQGESISKPETLLLINLSIECKYDIKGVHGD